MTWLSAGSLIAAHTLVLLSMLLGFWRGWRRKPGEDASDQDGSVQGDPPAAQGKVTSKLPRAGGRTQLQLLLHADLQGRPGYFATRWEREVPFQLVLTIGDPRSRQVKTHQIEQGILGYWNGGPGKTIHDAGFALVDPEVEVLKERLVEFLQSLQTQGWQLDDLLTQARSLDYPSFVFQVRWSNRPYDTSPKPGPYQHLILETILRQ
jgi:hypothetical protein